MPNAMNDQIRVIDSWRRVYMNKDTEKTMSWLNLTAGLKTDSMSIPVIAGRPLVGIEMKTRALASNVSASAVTALESLLEAVVSEIYVESVKGVSWYQLNGTQGMELVKGLVCDWNSKLIQGTTMTIAGSATASVLEQVYTLPIYLDQDFYGQHRIYFRAMATLDLICKTTTEGNANNAVLSSVRIELTFKYGPDHDCIPFQLLTTDLGDHLNAATRNNVASKLPEEVVVVSYWVKGHSEHDWYKVYPSQGAFPCDANDAPITDITFRTSHMEKTVDDYSMTNQNYAFLRDRETYLQRTYLLTTYTATSFNKSIGLYPGHMMRMVHETLQPLDNGTFGGYTGFLFGENSTMIFNQRTAIAQCSVLMVTITNIDNYPFAGEERTAAEVASQASETTVATIQPQKKVIVQSRPVGQTLASTLTGARPRRVSRSVRRRI